MFFFRCLSLKVICVLALLGLFGCRLDAGPSVTFIRVNQVGFEPDDPKIAVVISTDKRLKTQFALVDTSGAAAYSSELKKASQGIEGYPYVFKADFTAFIQPGRYSLSVGDQFSLPFTIASGIYLEPTGALLEFYRTQRCGSTSPINHEPCHLADAAHLISDKLPDQPVDVAGGWHDAADYTKFLNTTAYASYLMLLAYELRPSAFADEDGNGVIDVLEEARIGLDWCQKAHFQPDRLIIQVQNQDDHSVGLRLPEMDPLAAKRPAYDLPSQAHCGITAAALALGCQVFKKAGDFAYGDGCLRHAMELFNLASSGIPEFSSGPDSIYVDKTAWDNLSLAAAELYRATGETEWLESARELLNDHEVTHWVSWGDLGEMARVRLAPYDPASLDKLTSALQHFQKKAAQEAFGYPLDNYPWGSAGLQMGIAMLAALHHNLTGNGEYLALLYQQRDFILGRNRHGISLITGSGSDFPLHPHHQVDFLKGGGLKGALVGGYIDAAVFNNSGVKLKGSDRFQDFQTETAVYHDDFNDYLCNEPSISNNAQALVVFAWLCPNASR